MRLCLLSMTMALSLLSFGQVKSFISFGLNFRQFPVDIEDQPRGGLPASKGLPSDDTRFWKVFSVQGSYGIILKKKFFLSVSGYSRYNLLHRVEGVNWVNPFPKKTKEKRNFKCDLFLDLEKKIKLKENKERYFFAIAGVGFTNINTRFDITLTDTSEFGTPVTQRYEGNFFHLTPRISLGYQYEKIKASLDSYIIEGPDRTHLTSLWLGATIGYEIKLKKKKSGK